MFLEASSLNFSKLNFLHSFITTNIIGRKYVNSASLSQHIGMFLLHISLNMKLLHTIVTVNPFMPDKISHPFMPDEIPHPYQLDESISNLMVVG